MGDRSILIDLVDVGRASARHNPTGVLWRLSSGLGYNVA